MALLPCVRQCAIPCINYCQLLIDYSTMKNSRKLIATNIKRKQMVSSIFISSNKFTLKLKDELELSFEEEELEETICENEEDKNFESGWDFF
jgi:hypothetical protein